MAKKNQGPKTPSGKLRKATMLLNEQQRTIDSYAASLKAIEEARAMDRIAMDTMRVQLHQADLIEVAANNYTNAVLRQPSDQREINATQEALIQVVLTHRKNNGLIARTVAPARRSGSVAQTLMCVAGSDMVENEKALKALD